MLIANPIYDTAFKRLMDNHSIAKFFIGTLIEEEIVSLEVKPQEYLHKPNKNMDADDKKVFLISLFRVDFAAVIKTRSGVHKKILIEVQKSRNRQDIMRFRQYLAEHYARTDSVDGQEQVLPIMTIYVLDFELPEVDSPCFKVERGYIDVATHKKIDCIRSNFVECLSHDSFVVQAPRIKNAKLSGKLSELLSVFEQDNFVEATGEHIKDYFYEPQEKAVKQMIDELHFVVSDVSERKELENEREFVRTMKAIFGNSDKKIESLSLELAEQKKKNAQKEEALAQKEAELICQRVKNEQLEKLLAEIQKTSKI
jgi:hypothetical protein